MTKAENVGTFVGSALGKASVKLGKIVDNREHIIRTADAAVDVIKAVLALINRFKK